MKYTNQIRAVIVWKLNATDSNLPIRKCSAMERNIYTITEQ